MTEKINNYLDTIEKENSIKILLACEAGSRAWGFPSPNSDYDIRILYMHQKDWYLSLYERKDTIELMYENNGIDITGWDLKKALILLQKSNAALIEKIQSPILYRVDNVFLDELNVLATERYSRITIIHHYLSMAKKFLEDIKQKDSYKLKTFFYALRAATACKWIVERPEMPPTEFQKMLDGVSIDRNLLIQINALIKHKATISKKYEHHGESALIQYIEHCIEMASNHRKSLPSSKGSIDNLNSFFFKTLTHHDYSIPKTK